MKSNDQNAINYYGISKTVYFVLTVLQFVPFLWLEIFENSFVNK